MHLLIDKFGAFIGKEGNCFRIKLDNEKQEYSADSVEQIIIQSPCSISSDAVKLAIWSCRGRTDEKRNATYDSAEDNKPGF